MEATRYAASLDQAFSMWYHSPTREYREFRYHRWRVCTLLSCVTTFEKEVVRCPEVQRRATVISSSKVWSVIEDSL
jgi:hypothetical protein